MLRMNAASLMWLGAVEKSGQSGGDGVGRERAGVEGSSMAKIAPGE